MACWVFGELVLRFWVLTSFGVFGFLPRISGSVVVGCERKHPGRSPALDAAALRAVNTKDYLVTEKGIDASRVAVYTGSSDSRAVDTTLIPAGAALYTTALTAVDGSVKPGPRTTVPKR